ncbi:hypothetical protein F5878DRAFT_618277 [Lentinula raphanica]|uniref:Uncharacterized protein n=1 Tax=Lentinula raphanica TaxID=153919 RepID=A0AA38P9L6_9AGAR|nr:hypothetical protein F5878DRAFT_618277 [Lentinula raphanica]
MKIYTKLKGKISRRRGGRSILATAGSGGTGIADTSCGTPSRPFAKPPTRSIGWDLSDQVLTTLTTAAQLAPVPYLSSLSAVALSIFKTVQGAKDNQDGLGELAKTACDLASSVLHTYKELHSSNTGSTTSQDQSSFSSDSALNGHVEQLVETFTNINDWIIGMKSRKLVSKLLSYKSDLREIQKFRNQLRDAMDKFQLQSSITLRTNASQTEKNNVTRHEQTQERLIIIHEEMQVLIRRNSPISDPRTSSISSSSSKLTSHANITPRAGGSDTVIEPENPDGVGAATAMNLNGPLAMGILQPTSEDDSQPASFVEGNVPRPDIDATFIQENANDLRFGSVLVLQGNVPDLNVSGIPPKNAVVDNLIKERLGYVIRGQCMNIKRGCDTVVVYVDTRQMVFFT